MVASAGSRACRVRDRARRAAVLLCADRRDDGLLPALGGAALLTVATGAFLVLGYRALRAESSRAWKARRWAQAAARQAADVREQAAWDMADWYSARRHLSRRDPALAA